MKYCFVTAVFFLVCITSLLSQDKKIDIEISKDVRVISSGIMGAKGAYMEIFNPKPVKKSLVVTFKVYDNSLVEKVTVVGGVRVGEQHQCSYADSLGVYSVYSKSLSGDFSFLWCANGEIKTIQGNLGPKADCDQIIANGNMALLCASDKNSNDFILSADFSSATSSAIFLNKAVPKADVKIVNISFNKQFNQFYVVYTLIEKKNRKLCAMIFDKNLVPGKPIVISAATDDEKFLMTASFNPISQNEFIICGTYQNEDGDYANGMYIGKWTGSNFTTFKDYSFSSDFKHFNDYLSDKQKDKADSKKEKAEKRGKEFNVDVLMITHSLLNFKGTYILVGEIYYPEYRTYTDSKGITTTVFVGYRYPQAIIVGFNESFDKIWDNSFAIGIGGIYFAREIVQVQTIGNDGLLFFNSGTTIQSIKFNGEGTIDAVRKIKSYTVADAGEKVTASYGADVAYWYGSYFLATGIAREKTADGKQIMFYMKRILLSDK